MNSSETPWSGARERAVNKTSPSPCAFTLVELLLASALATLLMVGVLAVVTHLARSEKALQPLARDDTAARMSQEELDAWITLLRADLQHAGRIERLLTGEVEMLGYQALQGASRQVGHRPVRIGYRLQEVDGRRWVMRWQTSLDSASHHRTSRDLVATGVRRFEIVPQIHRTRAGAAAVPMRVPSLAAADSSGSLSATGIVGFSASGTIQALMDLPDYRASWHQLDGQWLCIANTPPWIKAIRPDVAATSSSGLESRMVDASPSDAAQTPMETFKQVVPQGGYVWRLRVWTDTSTLPTHDRILTIQ